MYVCICHAVTATEVAAEIATGACTEDDIGERCRAGTGCGSCVEKICAMLQNADLERDNIAFQTAV